MKNLELVHIGQNQRLSFMYSDHENSYLKNLKTRLADWQWRHKEIWYETNDQGYRCKNWNEYDWNNSILFFGGSIVFGVGVSSEQTVPAQLSQMLNYDVINLGAPATSPAHQWINTTIIKDLNISPVAVIYIWPISCRYIEFTSHSKVATPTGVQETNSKIGTFWIKNKYQGHSFLKYVVDSCDHIWDCPVLHYSMHNDLDLPIEKITILPKVSNDARDFAHPGPDGYSIWANIIKNDYETIDRQ